MKRFARCVRLLAAMNRIDYFNDRARELRRKAGDTRDPKLKQQEIEASQAFERLAALAIERRPQQGLCVAARRHAPYPLVVRRGREA